MASVNLTRDSLQEAFFERPRRQSMASCIDQTTKFLNPQNQGFGVRSAQLSSDDDSLNEEEYSTSTNGYSDHTTYNNNNYSDRIVSGLEDSLCMSHPT